MGCLGNLDDGLGCPKISQADANDFTEWIQRAQPQLQREAITPESRGADVRLVRQAIRSTVR